MNTFMSARLRSSSRAPAIQYSRSEEASALVQEGSSLVSAVGVADPSARAAMMSVMSREGSSG